ncbi:MAG: hypothetical protein ACLFVS_06635 [Candidatus Acetothermia bacterium]
MPLEATTNHEVLHWENPSPPTADYVLRGAYVFYSHNYDSFLGYRLATKRAIMEYGALQTYKLFLTGGLSPYRGAHVL